MHFPTRTLPSLVLSISLFVAACGEQSAADECTEFLNGYEGYVEDYIDLAKEVQKDPANPGLMQKVSSMAADAQKWAPKGHECEKDPEFIRKYAEVQGRLSSAMIKAF